MELTGSPAQIEWAQRIRLTVVLEFDRVARVLEARMAAQTEDGRTGTANAIAILEKRRIETLANTKAGYFIREWQEISNQVSQMIAKSLREEGTLSCA